MTPATLITCPSLVTLQWHVETDAPCTPVPRRLLIALTTTGYALIFVLHGMPFFTIGCFAIICLILIGLQV